MEVKQLGVRSRRDVIYRVQYCRDVSMTPMKINKVSLMRIGIKNLNN